MPAHVEHPQAFTPACLRGMKRAILGSPHFTTHTLNRDFVQTRGFSIVFRGDGRKEVERAFPAIVPYLERALRSECNAFYLNPLELGRDSRVDPHVDRSLRSYCKDILPPFVVSVLYVDVPRELVGGALVLARGKRRLARIQPVTGSLVFFDGDLTHSIERVESGGNRLSLVCEQYCLEPEDWRRIPRFAIETRARTPY